MHRYVVDLHIPATQLLRYYRGTARGVVVRARSGERVRFPADVLRSYVDREGVRGTFSLSVDAGNRLRRIERLG
jgi:hypothetical protein